MKKAIILSLSFLGFLLLTHCKGFDFKDAGVTQRVASIPKLPPYEKENLEPDGLEEEGEGDNETENKGENEQRTNEEERQDQRTPDIPRMNPNLPLPQTNSSNSNQEEPAQNTEAESLNTELLSCESARQQLREAKNNKDSAYKTFVGAQESYNQAQSWRSPQHNTFPPEVIENLRQSFETAQTEYNTAESEYESAKARYNTFRPKNPFKRWDGDYCEHIR